MGPIADLTPELIDQLMQRLEELTYNRQVTDGIMQSPSDYTKSGRPITNPSQSRAVMPAMGQTVGGMVTGQGAANIEEAANRAAQALGTPVEQAPAPQEDRSRPKIPLNVVKPLTAAGLFLQLLLHSSQLNQNEAADLAARRKLAPN